MVAMKYLVVGFIYIVKFSVSAATEDDMIPCMELFNPDGVDLMCCETIQSFDNMTENYSECLKKDSEEWLCEDFQCILTKMGAMKDGKIDEDGAMKFYDKLEKDYPKEKALIGRVRRECMGGKYESYPPEDGCAAVKLYVCTYINTYLDCDSWKDSDVCSEMAENAKKCNKALRDN